MKYVATINLFIIGKSTGSAVETETVYTSWSEISYFQFILMFFL